MTTTSNNTHPSSSTTTTTTPSTTKKASATTPSGVRQPPASASLSLSLSLNQHHFQQQQQIESPYYPQRFLPSQMVMGSPFYQNSDSSFRFNSPVTDNFYSNENLKNTKSKLNSKKLDKLPTENNINTPNNSKIIQAESSPVKSSSPPLPPLSSSKSSNINTRSLKFSNLRNDISLAELLELINFGPIETCYFDLNSTSDDSNDSRSIIISFIDGRVANDCYNQSLDIIDELKHLLDSPNLSLDPTDSLPLSDFIQNEININGASRVICLSNLPYNLNNDILFNELSNFGTIQLIDYNINKNAAFAYFTSIFMAIKCFDQLPLSNSILSNCKIFYSNDSITFLNNHHSNNLNNTSYLHDTFANYADIHEESETENENDEQEQERERHQQQPEKNNENNDDDDDDDDIQFYNAQDNTNPNMVLPYSRTSTSISTPRISSTTDLLNTKRIISNNRFNSGFFNDSSFNTPLAPTITNDMYDLSLQHVHNSTISLASLPQNNIGNRTVYLGNLASNTTFEDICNKIRGGIIEKLKLFPEKRVAFISFVYHEDAANFISRFFNQNLFINSKCIKIGWGKNSGNLSPDILSAIENDGACRNLYIGVNEELETDDDFQLVRIDPFESKSGGEEFKKVFNLIPNEKTLRSDFSIFGDIEQINFFKNGSCAFINFTSIYSCINAIAEFQNSDYNDPNDTLHTSFDNRYRKLNIAFGKDRCANPPKKKRSKKKSNNNTNNTNNTLDSNCSNRSNTPNIQFHTFSLSDDNRSIDTDLALKFDNAFTGIGISSPSATKKVEVIKDDPIIQSTVLESDLETSSGKEDLPNTVGVINEDDEGEDEDEEDIDIITDTLNPTDELKQKTGYTKIKNNKNTNSNNNNNNGRHSNQNQKSNKSTRRNSYSRNPSRLYSCSRSSSVTSFHNYPYNNPTNNFSFTYSPENSFVSDNQNFIMATQPYYFSPPQGSTPAQYPISTMPSTTSLIRPYSSSYYPQQPQSQQQQQQQPTAPPGYYYYSTPHHRSLPQLYQLPHAQPLQQPFESFQPQQPHYSRRYSKGKINGKFNKKGECSSSNCTSNDNSTPEF